MNLYGHGDNFDPETSHVIPAMIRKCSEALEQGSREIVLWGDGSPTRGFLYVEDAAERIIAATERYDKPAPVNLGSGMEISIRDLAGKIAEFTGFRSKILWDQTKPNGQPRRCLDISRAYEEFGWRPRRLSMWASAEPSCGIPARCQCRCREDSVAHQVVLF